MDLGDWFLEVNGRKVGPFTLDQIQGFLDDGEIRAYHQVTSNEMGGRWISVEELLEAHPGGIEAPPPPPPSDFSESTVMVAAPVAPAIEVSSPAKAAPKPAPKPAPTPGVLNRAPEIQAAPEQAAYQTEYVPAPDAPSIAEIAANYSPDSSFQPPPRPEIDAYVPIDDKTDPAISLFNALQIVRERQAASFHPPAIKAATSRKALFKVPSAKIEEMTKEVTKKITRIRESIPLPEQVPARMWLAAALIGIVLGALTMGVFKLLKPKLHPTPGSLTQVNGFNPDQSVNKPIEMPKHALPPPPISGGRAVTAPPMIVHPGADNFADHPNDRPENNPPPPQDPQQQQQQPYQDPNNPYPQEANGEPPNPQIPPAQQPNAPPPPQPQFDQNGNPIQQVAPPPPGFDAQGNPLPGYDPNQVPQPGQPGAPGQDTFQPGVPQQ